MEVLFRKTTTPNEHIVLPKHSPHRLEQRAWHVDTSSETFPVLHCSQKQRTRISQQVAYLKHCASNKPENTCAGCPISYSDWRHRCCALLQQWMTKPLSTHLMVSTAFVAFLTLWKCLPDGRMDDMGLILPDAAFKNEP